MPTFFQNIFRSRDKPQNRVGGGWSFLFGGSSAGANVNERTAMQTSAVFACVKIIAESIAALPLHVYKEGANKSKERATDHPLYYLLHDEPNSEMTSFIFRETLMTHLLLWGNAYAQITRDGRGRITALYPLLPSQMEVEREKGGKLLYTYSTDDGETKLRRENLLHIVGLGFDGLIGYSPIALAKNAIGMAIATEQFGANFFANGANPGGVLETDSTVKDKDSLRSSWQSQFGGANAHRVAVLEEGLKFKAMAIPPEQAQFLETRKFQLNEIARIFRVPPHMIGDLDRSTNNNIEEQALEFVKFTLSPWIMRLEQAMKQALLSPSEKGKIDIRFNLNGIERGDIKTRSEFYRRMFACGAFSPNMILGLEDMNLLSDEEGGNLHLVNGSLVKLAEAGLAYRAKNGNSGIKEDDNGKEDDDDI